VAIGGVRSSSPATSARVAGRYVRTVRLHDAQMAIVVIDSSPERVWTPNASTDVLPQCVHLSAPSTASGPFKTKLSCSRSRRAYRAKRACRQPTASSASTTDDAARCARIHSTSAEVGCAVLLLPKIVVSFIVVLMDGRARRIVHIARGASARRSGGRGGYTHVSNS
jgi:hypothetical protein